MFWSTDHDILFCREILLVNPYRAKKGTNFRSSLWEQIAVSLCQCSTLKFVVDKRSVRDHIAVLINRYKKKMRAEENASGIDPDEPSELDTMVEEIIELEESAAFDQQIIDDEKKDNLEKDREKAQDMRQKAMEKLSETSKRKGKEENEPVKKKRRSAFDTLQYLKEKAEREKGVKEKELQMRKEDKEVQMQFFTQQSDTLKMLQEDQQQQREVQQQQRENQQQLMTLQMAMMQQQQEQNRAILDVMNKIVNKN